MPMARRRAEEVDAGRIAVKTNGACQSRLPNFGAANERNVCRFNGYLLARSLH